MVRSMMLRNPHVRAIDKFFDSALTRGFSSPFAVMDKVLDTMTTPIPPADGEKFTVYKMVPVTYVVEHQEDGSVHYNIVQDEEAQEEEVGSYGGTD